MSNASQFLNYLDYSLESVRENEDFILLVQLLAESPELLPSLTPAALSISFEKSITSDAPYQFFHLIIFYLIEEVLLRTPLDSHFLKKMSATLLFIACSMNNIKLVRLLLKKNEFPSKWLGNTKNPLHRAIEIGNSQIVELLLKYPPITHPRYFYLDHLLNHRSYLVPPFYYACSLHKTSERLYIIDFFLKKEEFDPNRPCVSAFSVSELVYCDLPKGIYFHNGIYFHEENIKKAQN